MAKRSPSEQFDRAVTEIFGRADAPSLRAQGRKPGGNSGASTSELARLSVVANGLKNLPRADFKARLKADLERRATMATPAMKSEFRATATPYLSIRNAAAALEFYKKAFGATEDMRLMQPDGRVGHAEIDIAGAKIMIADEFPEAGFTSPETLGGSPIHIHLDVEDVDSFVERAVAAGATLVRSVSDQFYGSRSGHVRDPFGYTWTVSTRKENVSTEEMQRRLNEMSELEMASYVREGFHTITPYLVIPRAGEWLDFVKRAFGAEEHFRANRPDAEDLIMHAEVKIGDSMIEVGDANDQFSATPCTLLLRVADVDGVYARALDAGATAFHPVADQPYGSRGGTVVDGSGNRWHIFNPTPGNKIFEAFHSVTPHLYATEPVNLINFLHDAFGGTEVYRAEHGGGIPHAQVRIGDSIVALAGGHGPYTPMPSTLHLYVPDADATYKKALSVGAVSIQPPADQPYGERNAGVRDPFGNRWFIATPIRQQSGA